MRLAAILDRLEAAHGRPKKPVVTEPFQQVLLENVAYLATDEKRARAFEALRAVGLTPARILGADRNALHAVAALGGARHADRG